MALSLFLSAAHRLGLLMARKANRRLRSIAPSAIPGERISSTPPRHFHKEALFANGIRRAADIVRNMRNPGPGMTKFDEKTIPDETARAIAEYILKTFQ